MHKRTALRIPGTGAESNPDLARISRQIQRLNSNVFKKQLYAACTLGNIAALKDGRDVLGAQGHIPKLIQLLEPGISNDIRKHAARTLSNIAMSNRGVEAICNAPNGIRLLVQPLWPGISADTQRHVAHILAKITYLPKARKPIFEQGGLDFLFLLLQSNNAKTVEYAARAVGNLTYLPEVRNAMSENMVGISRLVELLRHDHSSPLDSPQVTLKTQEYAARALANITCLSKGAVAIRSYPDAVSLLVQQLQDTHALIHAVCALSNIAMSEEGIDAIQTQDGISRLGTLLLSADHDIRLYVVRALTNIADFPNGRAAIRRIQFGPTLLHIIKTNNRDWERALSQLQVHTVSGNS